MVMNRTGFASLYAVTGSIFIGSVIVVMKDSHKYFYLSLSLSICNMFVFMQHVSTS